MAAPRNAGDGLRNTARNLVVVLVTASAGLTAVFAGGSLRVIAGVLVLAFACGLVLATFALPSVSSETKDSLDDRLEWED